MSNPSEPRSAYERFQLVRDKTDEWEARQDAPPSTSVREWLDKLDLVSSLHFLRGIIRFQDSSGKEWRLSELLEAYAEHKTDSLRAVLERWKKAVEGLTPSGSEFVDDPENCAAYIRKRTQYPQIIINLRAGNERLRGELAQAKREHAGSLVKEVQDHIDELAVAERRAEAAERELAQARQERDDYKTKVEWYDKRCIALADVDIP